MSVQKAFPFLFRKGPWHKLGKIIQHFGEFEKLKIYLIHDILGF
jgi:hypothetical protein